MLVLVGFNDTWTKWSDRFFFLHVPNTRFASVRNLVVLDFSTSAQLFLTMSVIGGLPGLCVTTK